MDNLSGRSMAYGALPSKESHRFSTTTTNNNNTNTNTADKNTESMGARRVKEFMASKNEGGDPVTALGVRGETSESSTAARRAKVTQDINTFKAQYDRPSGPDTSTRP
ncbi:hypothetical protein F5X99DRAFT_11948 [Biscogniauxia marginata]|nr:hypothetical protein F5X99DRAFT_11948 [Biscogniauxia marginata]